MQQSLGAGVSRWAQQHVYGIGKDAVAVKLTKAIMPAITVRVDTPPLFGRV
jgi:hypothetical protein